MRKPQIQPSLASLTESDREQLADWLRHREYKDVLERVNKPRPDGFGLTLRSEKAPHLLRQSRPLRPHQRPPPRRQETHARRIRES